MTSEIGEQGGGREAFPMTRWTLITRSQGETAAEATVAMEELCQRYWYPIYAFIRRKGYDREDAEDLAQGFFQRMLESDSFQRAEESRGRLRTFLLGSLEHFLIDDLRKQSAQKRGGGQTVVSIDEKNADGAYLREPQDGVDPAQLFEKSWARELLARAIGKIREDYEKRGKEDVFDSLQEFIGWQEKDVAYREVALRLGVKEGALRVAIFRLRQRFRDSLNQEIAETVDSPEEVEGELNYLMQVVGA